MEDLVSFHAYLKNLGHQAGILAEAAVSLSKSFQAEADRLTREDGVQRLKSIHATVVEELLEAELLEASASNEDSKANLRFSITGNIAKVIAAITTEDKLVRNIVNQAFDRNAGKERPYGMLMVCVGPKGMPDDVRVVSMSRLARESNRLERQVVGDLEGQGSLLFSEKAFSLLIEKLIGDVREGRLALPISTEKLSQMKPLSAVKPVVIKPEWIIVSPPQ